MMETNIIISDFVQGGFYVNNGSEYNSAKEIRSGWIETGIPGSPISLTISVNCGDLQWSFICCDDQGFRQISESSGYKNSGTAVDLSSYTWIRKIRIELHSNIGLVPPQSCTLNVNYTYAWTMKNGYPVPVNAPDLPEKATTKPFPVSLWRVDKLRNDGIPFTGLMPVTESINLWIQPSRPLIHVYGHTQQIYDKERGDFSGNGYAIIEPISCEVHQEENGEYSVSLETYCDEYGKYKYLKKQSLIKMPIKYHGEVKWQIFRIVMVTRSMDISGACRVSVEATHLFYDNNRILIRESFPNTLSGKSALDVIINSDWHGNEHKDYPFSYSSNIQTARTAYYENISLTSALIGADQCFVNRWGGKLYRDNYYFSINSEMEGYRDIGIIQYGFNMQEIEFVEDDTEVLTDLYAYDNFDNEITISLPNIPNETFPHRIYKAVSFSYEEDDVNGFEADAQAYFDNYKQSKVTITVRFANLSDLELYKDFLNLDNYEVGDKVTIYHKDLGIYYSNLEIISKTYDVVNQKTAEVVIGSFKNAISRRPFFGNTASGGQSAIDKQNVAMQDELRDAKLRTLRTWVGAKAFKWRETTKYIWNEVSGNGDKNGES